MHVGRPWLRICMCCVYFLLLFLSLTFCSSIQTTVHRYFFSSSFLLLCLQIYTKDKRRNGREKERELYRL
ncbi:hypothetical protein AQUCO_11300009v1 [Aquilegia coerulea]|uniref:Uncharacterized protein n=1 Tax=Aquilegia coerulea TaxID=218851 RepID=A0A2G5C2G4_AQUCA|nr:hypothetical protein AQUCO_11300009v1 [Aquilegia coerulea]